MTRRSIVWASIALALVVLAAGTAIAVTRDHGTSHRVRVADESPETTTARSSSTSTSMAPTTSTPSTPIHTPDSTSPTTGPASDPIPVSPSDLEGTLTLASTTLVADQAMRYTLTVRNITDHAIRDFPTSLGVWLDIGAWTTYVPGHVRRPFTLAAGEQRTFDSEFTPVGEMVGPVRARAALILLTGFHSTGGWHATYLTGVPTVSATVYPPGYAEGSPRDPALGKWRATISPDAPAHVGESYKLNVTLRNVGDHAQLTSGYSSLAVGCIGAPGWTHSAVIEPATLPPGAGQTFAVEFEPVEVSGEDACSLWLMFPDGQSLYDNPRDGIEPNSYTFTILPARTTGTTTSP